MLDVRIGEWAALDGGAPGDDAGAVKKALTAAASALASSAPKKGWATKRAAAKAGAGSEDTAATTTTTPPPSLGADPAAPAVRALAYRMPPDWGDGWLTKRAFEGEAWAGASAQAWPPG